MGRKGNAICGINAALGPLGPLSASDVLQTFTRCADRGKDAWSLVRLRSKSAQRWSSHGDQSLSAYKLTSKWPVAILGSHRAQPTTEVASATDDDVQPYVSPTGRWAFVHNGVISNDKQLRAQLPEPLEVPTEIDSWMIGPYLDSHGFDITVSELLEGSFAILAYDREHPDRLYYATNYKPLYVKGDVPGVIQVASQRDYLERTYRISVFDESIRALEQYTYGWIGLDGLLHVRHMKPKSGDNNKMLAVCSGGLDSVTAAWKYHREGFEVTLLHFLYQCKAESKERESVCKLSDMIGTKPILVPTSFFSTMAQSVLTDPTKTINTSRGGIEGAEFGHEWVPARNLVMLSLAIAYAEANGFGAIVLGNNLEEAGGGYPDNEQEFINRLNAIIPYAVKPYHQLYIYQPLATLMKKDIVKLGLELKVPYEHTWSCYEGGEEPCGSCGPCFMRQTAFKMNGTVDPLVAMKETS
jgi:7-cyano-7-deazaguanine synthase